MRARELDPDRAINRWESTRKRYGNFQPLSFYWGDARLKRFDPRAKIRTCCLRAEDISCVIEYLGLIRCSLIFIVTEKLPIRRGIITVDCLRCINPLAAHGCTYAPGESYHELCIHASSDCFYRVHTKIKLVNVWDGYVYLHFFAAAIIKIRLISAI